MNLQAIKKSAGVSARSREPAVFCKIKASFSKVINLESGGDIYAVQTEDSVFTPLSVTVERESFERLSHSGAGGTVELDLSHAGTVECRLQKAGEKKTGEWSRKLEESVFAMAKSGSLLEAAVDRLWRTVLFPAPWQLKGRRILEDARRHLEEGGTERAAYVLSGLSGLGPGLTPAGDDFLLGLLAVCRYWPEEWCKDFIAALKAALAERGVRTSWLSQALLKAAFDGEFALPIHHLFQAEDRKSLISTAAKVIVWGHTSGSDTAGGIVWMTARVLALPDVTIIEGG